MIPEPGNLLVMARLNFRVKCNNHFRDSAPLGRCLLFYESRHFFMECACSYELYMIKWQAILLRIHSFPPRTHERIIFLPRGGIATSFFKGKLRGYMIREEIRIMEKPYWEGKEYSYFSHKKCEYFPCHKGADPENFNCLFCYCPLYALGDKCGGNFHFTESGIKDCTACKLPHRRENYGYITGKYQELADMIRKQRENSQTDEK